MRRDMLSPEERAEYDDLLHQVGHDDYGNVLPSSDIGPRMRSHLEDAIQAGRTWAAYMLEDCTEAGCLKAWKDWHKAQRKVQVFHNEKLIPKTAAMSIKRRQSATGKIYHQLTFWEAMGADDLRQLIADAHIRIEGEKVSIATAVRLLSAIDETGAATVGEAMRILGTTVDDFLAAPQAA